MRVEVKSNHPVALITGAARRIGAVIARRLHQEGYEVIIHYRHSEKEAMALCDSLNEIRDDSACCLPADFNDLSAIKELAQKTIEFKGRVDVLVNNASAFMKTTLGETTEEEWNQLMNSQLKGPFFLSQALVSILKMHCGVIVNLTDAHLQDSLKDYPVYSMAKAGLTMMTYALAKELAPAIRVNAVALGPTLWPEGENLLDETTKARLIEKTLLKRKPTLEEIADTVLYLIRSQYLTGMIIKMQ